MKYEYRLLKSQWGIMIDFDADVFCALGSEGLKVGDKVFLEGGSSPDWRFKDYDIPFIKIGLERVLPQIRDKILQCGPALIHVHSVNYGVCDFQNEGIEAAAMLWAAQEFHFDPPAIETSFDKHDNKYVFKWGSQ